LTATAAAGENPAVVDPSRLRDVPLFASLSHKELERVSRWADEVDVPEGKKLMIQDALGYEFFVIEDGHAEVSQNGERIRLLGPGDFFGEIALLETGRRTADVVAASPMQLVVMHRREFKQMQRELPDVAAKIERAIRERFREPPE
jgi:CRP-like cAMP-binding protein